MSGEHPGSTLRRVRYNTGLSITAAEEPPLNKRKKVAWRKHRIRRKKLEEKRQIGTLARRK